MNCTPSKQARESLEQVAVGYAQVMAERLSAHLLAGEPLLAEMEKAVLEELHGFGNAITVQFGGVVERGLSGGYCL